MTLITKSLTTIIILAATASAGSAFAQSSSTPEQSVTQTNDWVLKKTASQNQTYISGLNNADGGALYTPRADENPELLTRIETPNYTRFDITNFKYPVLGPVKLGVQRDYQELLSPNNTLHANDITYASPNSAPYSQTPYQVATTATAQVKFAF